MQITKRSGTPWGAIQTFDVIADGIVWVTTASHGGYWLSPERMARVLALFPDCFLWAGAPWFEEDCDWCWVVLAFPEHFAAQHQLEAQQMLEWKQRMAREDRQIAEDERLELA